jgi:hypothetical protein
VRTNFRACQTGGQRCGRSEACAPDWTSRSGWSRRRRAGPWSRDRSGGG